MSFKVADTQGMSLSQLVTDLRLDQTANQGKELRSKGDDLYVKDKAAHFTREKSRTAHRESAIGGVKQALVHEYGLSPRQAERVMSRVLGGAPNQITGGDALKLHEVGQLAQKLIDRGESPVRAFARANDAHALMKLGANETDALRMSAFFPTVALLTALQSGDLAEFGRLVERLDDDRATTEALTVLEDGLVAKVDRGDIKPPVLTKASHDLIFRKKTEAFEQEIRRVVQGSDSPALKGLSGLPEGEYWKLLIDGKVHGGGDKHAYDRSRGFMASMMKGLEKIVSDIDKPLDKDEVKALHQCATRNVTLEHVKTTSDDFPLRSADFQETGLKRSPNAWGVCKDFSDQGMQELAALRHELDQLIQPGGYFTDDEMRFPDKPDVVQWKAGKVPQPELGRQVDLLMDHVIGKANTEIAKARGNPDKVLGAIVDCCRGLSIIHPFKDANGRLMNFLVLNKLLLQNGLSPTVLPDQGLMVGKSKAEIIELIKQGQAEVSTLTT